MSGTCDLRIARDYPMLYNQEALTAALRQQACNYLGGENVVDLELWMALKILPFTRSRRMHAFIAWEWVMPPVPGCILPLLIRTTRR